MNCATQQTASSHAEPEPRLRSPADAVPGTGGPAVVSTLTRCHPASGGYRCAVSGVVRAANCVAGAW